MSSATQVFAIQDDIAREVVTELRGTLSGRDDLTEQDGTDDVGAYEAFLRGRHQQLQYSYEGLPKAITRTAISSTARQRYISASFSEGLVHHGPGNSREQLAPERFVSRVAHRNA